ncbi:MAG: Oxygen-independent coproporphyrinogen-III oxidase 2 [Firmicutes bacterium ADurb.Bin262]|nr:MAG: Oxygen-independent coproporphyrinogen-III oxidase 2 [Firmicutes bacterium ADurb.Bin262]HQH62709.1 coproporphyrinogen dehydrogenase HemZ [Clostridiales bacterium]
MILCLIGHRYAYETENLCRVFFPGEKIHTIYCESESGDLRVVSRFCDGPSAAISAEVLEGGRRTAESGDVAPGTSNGELERLVCAALYDCLVRHTGRKPPWGMLTGVRPTKLMASLQTELGESAAKAYFIDRLRVSPEKTQLAAEVAAAEHSLASVLRQNDCGVYISVPFCPSRCSYCSFVSHSITTGNAKKLLPAYIDNLCVEITETGDIAHNSGLQAAALYIGGGTPTVLTAAQLDRVLTAALDAFPEMRGGEMTVEAGRPDTLDAEKLDVMKRRGVTRLSINPQSFSDDVLLKAGRGHSARETLLAYEAARAAGFDNINMDLIAGLPGDRPEGFMSSLEQTLALSTSNITVHALALKRASRLAGTAGSGDGEAAQAMIAASYPALKKRGYEPYYMYRQSLSPGNLENTGWCKKGFGCLYNVMMIRECSTVFACGAGAVTKLLDPDGRLSRVFNFKYPYEYNDRFGDILQRKHSLRGIPLTGTSKAGGELGAF